MNFYGLIALTAVMACDVGVVSALASAAGLGALVAQAALITALLVAGLTLPWLDLAFFLLSNEDDEIMKGGI